MIFYHTEEVDGLYGIFHSEWLPQSTNSFWLDAYMLYAEY